MLRPVLAIVNSHLQHVCASSDAAIHNEWHNMAYGIDDVRQHLDRCWHAVALPPAMVAAVTRIISQ